MEKFKLIIGVSALCLLFAFNMHHAVVYKYGVLNLNNTQHPQIYAQTNSAGNPNCDCGGWSAGQPICDGSCGGGTSGDGAFGVGAGGSSSINCTNTIRANCFHSYAFNRDVICRVRCLGCGRIWTTSLTIRQAVARDISGNCTCCSTSIVAH